MISFIFMCMFCVLVAEVTSTVYWRTPFESICNPKQLIEYIVMDLEVIKEKVLYFQDRIFVFL